MGRNSRERHKAKRKTATAARRRHRTDPPHRSAPTDQDETVGFELIAEQLLAQAAFAAEDGLDDEVARCRALLAEGPGGEAGIRTVNRVLLNALQRQAEGAWSRGWRPTELVRAARREHSARHGRLVADVIAARMRAYSPDVVDDRWRTQLDALEALEGGVWWNDDDAYLSAWGDRHGVDRDDAISAVIHVARLLAGLPPIELLGPVPGQHHSTVRTSTPRRTDVDDRTLTRVRALLAKAESTDFPDEADAFTAKAQELIARHRIDQALLAADTGDRERPISSRIPIDNPYEAPKTLLLQVVAEANNCRAVWLKRFGLTTVVGFAGEVEITELLFTSLLVQATRAMTLAGTTPRPYGASGRSGGSTSRSFRQSFLTAYASRIGERLNATTDDVAKEAAASADGARLLPVLAARHEAVQDEMDRLFPERIARATSVNNAAGWASGRAAADLASLTFRPEVAPD